VEDKGRGVKDFEIGSRVAVLCDSGFAEYVTVSQACALNLPKQINEQAFPGEPLACAMNIAHRSVIQAGENVAIVGIGFLGALLAKIARHSGARVTAISRRKFGQKIAEQFGADAIFGWNGTTADTAIGTNGGFGFDCVIECVGTQESLDVATHLTKERGRLVIAGYHQDGLRQVDMQLWNWRGLDVINAHERDPQVYMRGMRAALDAILGGWLDPTPLYTHFFPLDALADAFEALRLRPDGFLKALVVTA
jgi:threonine dehydrogenase-like Zn-dependent dehydrogenase